MVSPLKCMLELNQASLEDHTQPDSPGIIMPIIRQLAMDFAKHWKVAPNQNKSNEKRNVITASQIPQTGLSFKATKR
jgi:hypothetical protein